MRMNLASTHSVSGSTGRAVTAGIALLMAAAGPLVVGFALSRGPVVFAVLLFGIALTLAAATIQIVNTIQDLRRRKSAQTVREELRMQLSEALGPIPSLVSQLAQVEPVNRALGVQGAAQAVGTAIYMLVANRVPDVRANVLLIERGDRRMVSISHVGRGHAPVVFERGTARGDSAFRFALSHQSRRFDDLATRPPKEFDGSVSDYRSGISIPLWSDSGTYGMITVDAPGPTRFTHGDQCTIELVAELMTTALQVVALKPGADAAIDARMG
jgi:hypothetical protein